MNRNKSKPDQKFQDMITASAGRTSVSTPVAWVVTLSVPALFCVLVMNLDFVWYHALLLTVWYVAIMLTLAVIRRAFWQNDPLAGAIDHFKKEFPDLEADFNAMRLIHMLDVKSKQLTATSLGIVVIFVPGFCLGSCVWGDLLWWHASLGGLAVVCMLMFLVSRSENNTILSMAAEFNSRFETDPRRRKMAIETIRKYARTEISKKLLAELNTQDTEIPDNPDDKPPEPV